MPDTTPEQILARAQVPPANGRPGPQGRDRARTTAASTSSRGCPSAARGASRCCSSTASWPARGSGSATSATSPAAAGRATRSTCATTTGRRPPTRRRSRSTPTPRTSSRRSSGSGPTTVRRRPRDGRPARAQGRRADADLGPGPAQRRSCRATCGRRPGRTSCARSRRSTASSLIGWETLPERLLRDDRDLTLADVAAHPAPARPEAARGGRRPAPDARRRPGRSRGPSPRSRGSSSAPGSTGRCRSTTSERLAEWLGRGVRAVRGALALRAGRRREQLPAGRRGDPRVPRGEPALRPAGRAASMAPRRAPLVSCRPARRAARADGAAFV